MKLIRGASIFTLGMLVTILFYVQFREPQLRIARNVAQSESTHLEGAVLEAEGIISKTVETCRPAQIGYEELCNKYKVKCVTSTLVTEHGYIYGVWMEKVGSGFTPVKK